jgi:hypothetical protein
VTILPIGATENDMTQLVDQAIAALRALPPEAQDAVAREVLDRIATDARWEQLLADPRSEDLLARLADAALDDHRRGLTTVGDPSDRPRRRT